MYQRYQRLPCQCCHIVETLCYTHINLAQTSRKPGRFSNSNARSSQAQVLITGRQYLLGRPSTAACVRTPTHSAPLPMCAHTCKHLTSAPWPTQTPSTPLMPRPATGASPSSCPWRSCRTLRAASLWGTASRSRPRCGHTRSDRCVSHACVNLANGVCLGFHE